MARESINATIKRIERDAAAMETALLALLRASRGDDETALATAQRAAVAAIRRHAGYTEEGCDLSDACRSINGLPPLPEGELP